MLTLVAMKEMCVNTMLSNSGMVRFRKIFTDYNK